jgi:hypothetical protein
VIDSKELRRGMRVENRAHFSSIPLYCMFP